MSKRANGDARTRAVCKHCGYRIFTSRFLNTEFWKHEEDGRALPGGPYEFCRTTTATPTAPTREDESNG